MTAAAVPKQSRFARWSVLPVTLPLALFILTGLWGINFGTHWDEKDHIHNVQRTMLTRTFLPTGANGYGIRWGENGFYSYPSVIYWVGICSASPEILTNMEDIGSPRLQAYLGGQAFWMRYRSVCVCVTALAILWVYLAVLFLDRSWMEALLASCLIGTSWELAYHSRWIAPDAIMMMFGAMCLMFCAAAISRKKMGWLWCAAAAAGLGAGTKYTGVWLLVAVIWAGWWVADGSTWPRMKIAMKACVLAGLVYLVTTPGTVLQPWNFYAWFMHNYLEYSVYGHVGHTIAGRWEYFRATMQYLVLAMDSPFPYVAAILAGLGVVGWVAWMRESWKVGLLLIGFPLVYVWLFSHEIVLIVRNVLVVAPFMAILSARGAAYLIGAVRPTKWRRVAAVPVIGAILANGAFLFYAAWTIERGQDDSQQAIEAAQYIHSHPNIQFYLSPRAIWLLNAYTGEHWDGVPARPDSTKKSLLLVCTREFGQHVNWTANIWDLTDGWFGADEVNLNFYPNWPENHLMLVEPKRAAVNDVEQLNRTLLGRRLAAIAPAGYTLAALLDCGYRSSHIYPGPSLHGIRVRPTRGDFLTPPDLPSVLRDREEIDLEISGLDATKHYIVGVSSDAAIRQGIQESVYVGSRKILDQATGQFDLPAAAIVGGSANLSIRRQAGPQAIADYAWIYEKD